MKCVIIAGAPACGKSSLAQEFVKDGWTEINRDAIRFSVIDPGGTWHTYRFNKKNEKLVTKIWYSQLYEAAFAGENVVISDTLCNADRRRHIRDELKALGYDIIEVILDVSLDVLLERDSKRLMSVGASVIKQKYEELRK